MARATQGETAVADQTPGLSGDQFERLIAALTAQAQAAQPLTPETLKAIMLETNRTARKEAKPENETHPGISAFSYPEGDVAKPRPVLPFEFFWNNYPVHKFPETQHWRELELAAQVQPGEYAVLRKDGSKMAVKVLGERDADGKLTKVQVEFPISREEKFLVPPMSVLLYQIVNHDQKPLKALFVEAMQEHLNLILAA